MCACMPFVVVLCFCWLCSLVVRLLARLYVFVVLRVCLFVCFLFACVGALGCCLCSLLV